MRARQLIDQIHEVEQIQPPTDSEQYTKLVSEINNFLDDGDLSNLNRIRDYIIQAKSLSRQLQDPDLVGELRHKIGVLDGHYRYFSGQTKED